VSPAPRWWRRGGGGGAGAASAMVVLLSEVAQTQTGWHFFGFLRRSATERKHTLQTYHFLQYMYFCRSNKSISPVHLGLVGWLTLPLTVVS
jgi:hypothetical protein